MVGLQAEFSYSTGFCFYGLKVKVSSNVRRVVEDVEQVYRVFKKTHDSPDLQLHVTVNDNDISNIAGFVMEAIIKRSCKNRIFSWKRVLERKSINGRQAFLLAFEPQNPCWLWHIEHTILSFILMNGGNFLHLHAAAIARNNKAIILPGQSKSGKTTLSCALSKIGFSFLSDELTMIDKNSFKAYPFPRLPFGRLDAAVLFGDTGSSNSITMHSNKLELKYSVPIDGMSFQPIDKPVEIDCIIFPEFSDEANPSITPMTKTEAIARLYNSRCLIDYCLERENRKEVIDMVTTFVESVTPYKLIWNDIGETKKLLISLEREV